MFFYITNKRTKGGIWGRENSILLVYYFVKIIMPTCLHSYVIYYKFVVRNHLTLTLINFLLTYYEKASPPIVYDCCFCCPCGHLV